MLPLPPSPQLPISALSAGFDNVTNSYKFYWFLAILEHVRENNGRILPLDSLLACMTASVWYPIHYFRLSFGKQDQLARIVSLLGEDSTLMMDSPRSRIIEIARTHIAQEDQIGRAILSLADFVPYRFLRPFFAQTLRGARDWEVNRRIRQLAKAAFTSPEPCLYHFKDNPQLSIEIHPAWFEYLQQHLTILTGFCLWHLVKYLQKNNPNVPNIAGKLFEPQARDLRLARDFWNLVLSQSVEVTCIYSGEKLHTGNYSLDHFLPWRFVGHDLLWNLIPVPRAINSLKSDNLPDPAYLDPFAHLHYRAVQTVLRTPKAGSLLEDYILLFKVEAVRNFEGMTIEYFRETLSQVILPQMQIAANMGFSTGWRYRP
ncbi:MAG: HNH endonuclease domain-containing protein [Chloroflexota bacterium]